MSSRNNINTIPTVTLTDAATVNTDIIELAADYELLSVVAVVSNVSGTSAGTLTLQASLDGTSWFTVNGVGAGILTASPQASITGAALNALTIADGLIGSWVVNKNSYRHYRLAADGTGTQSTEIDISYKFQ